MKIRYIDKLSGNPNLSNYKVASIGDLFITNDYLQINYVMIPYPLITELKVVNEPEFGHFRWLKLKYLDSDKNKAVVYVHLTSFLGIFPMRNKTERIKLKIETMIKRNAIKK